MYIDSINSQDTDYAISSFQETLINTQRANEVKTIDFPSGYNLDSNLSFNIMFENGHMCSNSETPMTLNGKPIQVYSYSNNELINLRMIPVIDKIWTLKPKTLLELYYNGNQFIVVGNPIIYTTDDCDYYANGKIEYKTSIVTTQNQTNLPYNVLLQGNQIGSGNNYCVNTASGNNTLTFNPSLGVLSATTFNGALNGKASSATNADNATKFGGCTYDCAKADIRSTMVSMANIGTGTYQLALCTGANTISTSPSLTFNACEGILTATKFCGSFCGTADNACKFGGCTYDCAKADIRDGLTDCLGTVCWSNSSDNCDCNIVFCTNTCTVGVSSNSNHLFTYNPSTGTMCVDRMYTNYHYECNEHNSAISFVQNAVGAYIYWQGNSSQKEVVQNICKAVGWEGSPFRNLNFIIGCHMMIGHIGKYIIQRSDVLINALCFSMLDDTSTITSCCLYLNCDTVIGYSGDIFIPLRPKYYVSYGY